MTVSRWLGIAPVLASEGFEDDDSLAIPMMFGSNGSGGLSCTNRSLNSSSRSQKCPAGGDRLMVRTISDSQARNQIPY